MQIFFLYENYPFLVPQTKTILHEYKQPRRTEKLIFKQILATKKGVLRFFQIFFAFISKFCMVCSIKPEMCLKIGSNTTP